jgi:hypothetical protein
LSITSISAGEISDLALISPYEWITEKPGTVALGVEVVPNCDAVG